MLEEEIVFVGTSIELRAYAPCSPGLNIQLFNLNLFHSNYLYIYILLIIIIIIYNIHISHTIPIPYPYWYCYIRI